MAYHQNPLICSQYIECRQPRQPWKIKNIEITINKCNGVGAYMVRNSVVRGFFFSVI